MVLPGYQLAEWLYQGTRTLVYRGTRLGDCQPVIIKILRKPHPSFKELVQFRNQYIIARHLQHSGIVRPLALERYGNGYALIMPDEGAMALSDYWQHSPPHLGNFLAIAIQLAEALHYLNQEQIIHKDIKLANILICPETQQVKLIDFSISTLLPKEAQTLQTPNVLEGTLAYISPEQTGRMNRGIDYRSDFYSLGATLYQLLTGALPFVSSEPMELVHCHISQQPVPPAEVKNNKSNIEIPPAVSDIVMKLMAKNAEDRYQSALGLKSDLETCLKQWKERGKIEAFELATRDIAGRFLIPEKLYGREIEVETLLAVFERVADGKTEMMLVAGFSGIGKTAVVNEVHKPIVRQRGYFIKGKFDQFNRNIPFSAFVQAFRDLMEQLLAEPDAKLAEWQTKILAALGENGQVIIDVIPELELLIGKQPAVPDLSGNAAQNRFNLLFQKFIKVFTTPEHPLVIFVDDLQWADSASLKLMELLTSESDTGYLLLLGAYRDNEVSPAHPLMLTLDEIRKSGARLNTIILAPLSEADLNCLVADTLSCTQELARPLTELICQKTKGNPFFATQFLKGLYEDRFIFFNRDKGYWLCDMVVVRQLALTSDVVEFMASRLHKLPSTTQEILKLAACIGNQFDLENLAIVSERSQMEVATSLWKALQEGLILPVSETYKFFQGNNQEEKIRPEEISVSYKFLHDRVQQAAYSLIRESEKQITHLKIGKLLLRELSAMERDEKIFDIVNHLNFGRSLAIVNKEITREELAHLNLQATRKAKLSIAYEAAVEYASIGLKLLTLDSWIQEYELALNLHVEAVEVEYLNINFKRAEQLSEVVIKHARNLLDCIQIYILKIQFLIASNQLIQAVETALPILEKLGYPLVQTPENLRQIAPLPTLENLDKIPEMTDPYQLAALQLLAIITGPAYMGQPQVLPYIIFKLVNLSLEYGHSGLAGYGYGMHSLLLCGPLNDIEMGYHAGLLSLQLLEDFHAKEFACKIHLLFNMIRHWKEPAKNCLAFGEAIQKGLEIGDIVYASYCSMWFSTYLFFMGKPLVEIETKQKYYAALMQKYKQDYSFYPISIWQQLTLNLQGRAENILFLTGESFNEDQIQQLHCIENRMVLFFAYLAKLVLRYTIQDYGAAVQNADMADKYEDAAPATMLVSGYRFYDSLARLALYVEASALEQDKLLEKVTTNQEKMRVWADSAPENYQHKYDLVEAEKCRVLDGKVEAIALYDRAIAGAKENEYVHEEALANELAAKFYLDWGKEKIARVYMTDAYYGYAHWGAKAKTDQLEAKYPQLLAPILQHLQLTNGQTVTSTLTGTAGSSSSTTGLLDWATVLKASQSLSSEIHLDKLLSALMKAAMENAGADRGILLLQQPEGWQVAARYLGEGCDLPLTEASDEREIPTSVMNKVKRSIEAIIVNDFARDTQFAADPYLLQEQPKSFLCTPILNQGKLVGILYLENHLAVGAFTSDRVELLNMLCSQAAISLENARLYQQAQQALTDLQQAQLQLVQSEKMSTLGNLVAGVAHEINNPVGFIAGNLDPARDDLEDLFGLLDLYQQEYPHPSEAIQAEIEAIDLEFLRSDLPQLISSMREGTDRIRHISTSLRTFSRADKEHKVPFDLHQGIDSTLLILKHRLKANERRPEIEIVKDYGNLPSVQCFPGQLNQVFMNLIANAIDALEESNSGRSFAEIAANPNRISIAAKATAEQVTICIADNGTGMPQEVKQRIFEQGFTTKAVGKGTGLGMAIAQQIVEEKHGGGIACRSQVNKGTEFFISLPLS